jgi:hypothetical protein
MKTRHLLMSAGLVGAAWLAFFGDKSAGAKVAEPVARQSAMPSSISAAPAGKGVIRSSTLIEAASQVEPRFQAAQGETEGQILTLQPRVDLMGASSNGHGGDGLFSSKSWTPPPKLAKLEPALPPPPPTAPPLPFAYLGKQSSGGRTEVYLARGDEVIVVRDQSVIQNTYRVESIKPPTLTLVYLPLNEIQRLTIGATN